MIDIGFCGNLNNGVIANLFTKNIKDMYDADMKQFGKACYLIPVVDAKIFNFNQCAPIKDWAQLCLDKDDPFNKKGSQKDQLLETVTCGQSIYTSRDTQCYVSRLVRDTKSAM